MISRSQVAEWMREAVDEALGTPAGAHRHVLVERVKQVHPEVIDLGEGLLDDALLGMADRALKPARSETAQFPGMGDPCGTTVTVSDGEGHFVVKALHYANIDELEADLLIHDENVAAAMRARLLAERRNRRLIPLMRAHGLVSVGDALKMLANDETGETGL